MLFHTTASHMEELLDESFRKIVLLDFYAPWCAPCRALEPKLDVLSDRYEAYISAYSINVDTDGELAERFGVTVLPTVLILRDGTVTHKFEKEITEEIIEDGICS